MSIYGSLDAPCEDEHEDGCAYYVEIREGILEFSGQPCDCGQPRAPLVYQGSHILPADNDPRGGWVDIALVPSHITRDGRDDKEEDEAPWPYLRFGVNEGTVVLTRPNVEQIHDTLSWWLNKTNGSASEHPAPGVRHQEEAVEFSSGMRAAQQAQQETESGKWDQ